MFNVCFIVIANKDIRIIVRSCPKCIMDASTKLIVPLSLLPNPLLASKTNRLKADLDEGLSFPEPSFLQIPTLGPF